MALNFLNSGYFAGSVGIGVENPSKKLEVVGNTEVVGTLYVEAANNQIRLLDTNDSTVNFSVGANGTFQVRDVNASTTPFSIQKTAPDDSLVIKADGDVGINTSTPSTKLNIVGDSTLATQGTVLRVENTADQGSSQDIHIYNQYDRDIGIKFETLGGTNYIWQDSNSDDALIFTAGGNARATDSTLILEQDHNASFPLGSLGVGLTNPQVTLHVNGFARLNGGLQLDGANRKILAIDDTDLGLGTNNIERMTITSDGGISFGSTGTAYGTSGQVLTSAGNTTPTWTTPTTGTVTGNGAVNQVAFWTDTDSLSGNDKLYWDSTNDHLGIGDATPGSRLKVVSGSAETSIYTVDINHVRNNADVATHAMRLNVDFSGADTTTADRVSSALIIDLDSSADGDASDEHRIRGVNSDVRFTGFSDSVQSGYFLAESNNTTEKTAQLMGIQGQATHDSSSTNGGVVNMYGVYGVSSIQDLGDVDNAYGGLFITQIPATRGAANVGVTKGVEGRISIDKPDTITYNAMTAVSGVIDNNETTFPTFGNQYLFKGDYQGTRGGSTYGVYCEGDKHYFEGNVGIGTTSPDTNLEVESSTGGVLRLTSSDATVLTGESIGKIEFKSNDVSTGGNNVMGFIDSVATNVGTRYALSFGTGDAAAAVERMRIDNLGAVRFNDYGAGTLVTDASGNITVSSGGGAGGPYLPLAGGTMTGSIDFVNNKDISMTDSAGAVTRVMVLNTSNTMYIGPVDPYAGGSILYGAAAAVSFQRFFTGASERLRIGSNGNIAIGTTATTYRLQVEQDNNGNLLSRFHNTAANGQGLLIRAGGVSSANRILQLASENDTKVMTVNSNGRVGIGIANPTEKLEVVGNILITAALLSNQDNTDVDTGTETVANVAIATYTAAFFDFVIKKGTNVRSGTVYACHDDTTVEFTETSTQDLGDTSDVTLSVDISGGNMRLLATVTSDDWSVKSLIRAI